MLNTRQGLESSGPGRRILGRAWKCAALIAQLSLLGCGGSHLEDLPSLPSLASSSGGTTANGVSVYSVAPGLTGVVVASDSSGVLYLAGLGAATGTLAPVVYGKCSSNCEQASSWTLVQLSQRSESSVAFAVTSDGRPRISYVADDGPVSGQSQSLDPLDYRYLACDAGCTSSSNWSDILVYTDPSGLQPGGLSPLAISPDGTVAAIAIQTLRPFGAGSPLTDTAIWSCRSSCSSPGGWGSYTLQVTNQANATESSVAVSDMALGSDLVLRVVDSDLSTVSLNNPQGDLTLRICSSDCSVASNWSALRIADGAPARLAINGQNGVRVMAYELNPNPVPGTLFSIFTYLACDAQCSTLSSWKSASINASVVPGNSAGGGYQNDDDLTVLTGGFAFRLNSRGLPVVAYQNTVTSGYASCSGACDPSGTWTVTAGPSAADLAVDLQAQLPVACSSSSWAFNAGPSLAFDASDSPIVELGAAGEFSPQQCSNPDTSMQNLVLPIR
jgi:hypothetical protein